ncbi:MAG: helical backbone metal receptor [Candidatus Omnitrophota bacterium]
MKVLFIVFVTLFSLNTFAQAEGECPQRIISLGPALTEDLYILGEEDRIVGCTVYCDRPLAAKQKEKVSTVREVNLEKVVALRSDLVLATSLTNVKAIEKLRKLKVKVITFPSAKSFIEICGQFLRLSEIVGKKAEAERIISQVEEEVNYIKKSVENSVKPKVFVQVGAKPLVTVKGDSFVNDFVEFAGGINIAKNLKSAVYSREKVLQDNPDVIIIVTMGINGREEKKAWQRFGTLNAVKNDRIYIMDSDAVASPTPLIFAETLKRIVKILHPESGGV